MKKYRIYYVDREYDLIDADDLNITLYGTAIFSNNIPDTKEDTKIIAAYSQGYWYKILEVKE